MELEDLAKMSPQQELDCAKDFRDFSHEVLQRASARGSELSDEFTRLEVQIATILFAFASLFVGSLNSVALTGFSPFQINMMRLGFASGIILLVLSLVVGLLHIKRKEMFWDNAVRQRDARFRRWMLVVQKRATFEQGEAFHEGTTIDGQRIISSPRWTWILQTILLGLGVCVLLVLFMVLLFK